MKIVSEKEVKKRLLSNKGGSRNKGKRKPKSMQYKWQRIGSKTKKKLLARRQTYILKKAMFRSIDVDLRPFWKEGR